MDGSRAAQAARNAEAHSQLLVPDDPVVRDGQRREQRHGVAAALLTSLEQHAVRIEASRMFAVSLALAVAHAQLESSPRPAAASVAHCLPTTTTKKALDFVQCRGASKSFDCALDSGVDGFKAGTEYRAPAPAQPLSSKLQSASFALPLCFFWVPQ
ncbi:hypothetical protein CCMA1212_008070 [Trichoderma ghanense]|uniref:Uncharacterized protein n=1 Tax=Trichoderma ghanense TaxID=65468 RepID=A0ABY2GV63_9HYPO